MTWGDAFKTKTQKSEERNLQKKKKKKRRRDIGWSPVAIEIKGGGEKQLTSEMHASLETDQFRENSKHKGGGEQKKEINTSPDWS